MPVHQTFNLPLDILSDIADELSLIEDTDTVKSFSQCCHALLPMCQKHLFRTLIIPQLVAEDKEKRERKLRHFDEILDRSPHIATYVRKLHYCIALEDLDERAIHQTLIRLQRIEEIELAHRTNSEDLYLDWAILTPPLMSSILSVIHGPCLRSLSITSIKRFPASVFTSISHTLVDLKISRLQLEDPTHAELNPNYFIRNSTRLPQISSLRTYGSAQATITLVDTQPPIFDFSQLNHLSIEWDSDGGVTATSKLVKIARSMEILRCRVLSGTFYGLGNVIVQCPYQSLKTLEAVIIMPAFESTTDDLFMGLCQELEHLSGSNSLTSLSVYIFIVGMDDTVDTVSGKLGGFDGVISRDGYPHLRTVTLDVGMRIKNGIVVGCSQAERIMTRNLYQACSKICGIDNLVFRCSARYD